MSCDAYNQMNDLWAHLRYCFGNYRKTKQNKTNDTRGDKCHSVIYLEAIEPKRTCVALESQFCHLLNEEGLLLFGKSCFSLSRTFRLSGPVFIYLEPALDLLISTSMGLIP